MASILKLPPELDDVIMSFLVGNQASLRACALTCKAWVIASRKVLYCDIKLETESQFDAFKRTVLSRPHVGKRVRVLRIDRSRRKYKDQNPWINNKLLCILRLLKGVRTFELINVNEQWGLVSMHLLSVFCKAVTKLSVISCGMSSVELFYLISAFSSLNDLVIKDWVDLPRPWVFDVTWNWNHTVAPALRITKLTLQTSDCLLEEFFGLVLMTGARTALRDVAVAIDKQSLAAYALFLSGFGSQLEHLELRFRQNYGDNPRHAADIVTRMNLAVNTGLKSLTFRSAAQQVVFGLLSQIAAPHLERITFRTRINSLQDIRDIRPDFILFLPHLKSVREVRVLYTGRYTHAEVSERFEDTFGEIVSGGMILLERDYEA
ncbi:hypothetical protein QCA50_011470 [Cerrena zonata]|uniref:F-box domain-containing protein n=1 Tax=Cerrena zonata TaxID=2478898 RepID=A0AAW0FX26_9APHY